MVPVILARHNYSYAMRHLATTANSHASMAKICPSLALQTFPSCLATLVLGAEEPAGPAAATESI